MDHKCSVYDSDMHFLIDPVSRKIKNQSNKTTIVQGDHNSERFTFQINRNVEGHDMSECNVVQIHYLNGDYSDVYPVEDLQVYEDDETVVIFSWLLSGNATQHNGSLNFAIRFLCVKDGVITYSLGTSPYNEINVGDTITNTEGIVKEYPDILAEWEARIVALEEGETGVGSGVYVGTGEMPNGYNVQIDPEGEAIVIPTKVSDLENDLNFITADDISEGDGSGGIAGKGINNMYTYSQKIIAEGERSEVTIAVNYTDDTTGYFSFDAPPGIPGKDYVLTDDDKSEIAEQAAELIEVPGGSTENTITDPTLTQEGVAADAKVVGDKFKELDVKLSGIENLIDESGVIEYDNANR